MTADPIALLAPLDGWLGPLDDLPDAVFAERMLGDGIAIDPTGNRLVAPCAGTIASLQPSGHAITIATDAGAEILIHLGLDTVMLNGRGFAPQVALGERVTAGQVLIGFDLDLLVCEARAVVTPVIAIGDGWRIAERARPGPIAAGDPLMTLVAADTAPVAASAGGERHVRTLTVPLPHGIHARPAARLAAAARPFDAVVTIAKDHREASVASPTGLLALAIGHGDAITIAASGPDAAGAVAALVALIEGGMDEAPTPPSPAPPARPATDVPDGALAGVTAAPGLAIGTVHRHRTADIAVPETGCGVASEDTDFAAALAALTDDLNDRVAAAHGPAKAVLHAHLALLADPALLDAARSGIAQGHSAGHAWRAAIRPQADALRGSGDPRLAERADDLIDLERQLLARLPGLAGAAAATELPPGTILVADDLLPSDLIGVRPGALAGIASARGGPTSHVAIIAASIGLPALVAVGAGLDALQDGAIVVLDATGGWLHPAPTAGILADAEARIAAGADRRAAMLARAAGECRTADGTRIEVVANCAAAADAAVAVDNGAEGCGLLRTELLFLDRSAAPSVEEQAAAYQSVADALQGRPLIVRLLDIGGDKPVPYLPIGPEENPALGLRGIRVGLSRPALLAEQLRAILSVRPVGQCRIMVPMVADLGELRTVRAALDAARAEMGIVDPVPLGIMVETPAAAITADLLAAEADFLSIGTNDLTQYTLAMDRGNAAVAAALDGLHPAILRLIAETCRGGARHGRWTGVCGGLASDPLAVPILVGLGVTELSASPALVPEVKAIVAALSIAAARDHAAAALACASAAEVRALARRFAEGLVA